MAILTFRFLQKYNYTITGVGQMTLLQSLPTSGILYAL